MLVLLLLVIGGLTWLLLYLLGKAPKLGPAEASPSPDTTITESTPTPAPTETPELQAGLSVSSMGEEALAALGYQSDVYVRRDEVSSYSRESAISFPRFDSYSALEGILTFGGNNYRNTFTFGTQIVSEKTLTRAWDKSIGSLDCGEGGIWSGTGWTGMPLMIRWPDDVRPVLGVYEEFKSKTGFTEAIYPAMDGKIYFFELSTGKTTREPLDIGVVNKGTASLDPRGYPLLYLGQGIQSTSDEGTYGAWFRIVSLIDNSVIWSFGGRNPVAYREWQAYDSSALISAESDTLIVAGENGLLYSTKLNSAFDAAAGTVSVSPESMTKYRYTAAGYGETDNARWYGMEDSVAAWRNYAFFTDNGGLLQCVDLNTLSPAYVVDLSDDGDASIVIEEDPGNNTFYLYAASKTTGRTASGGYGKSHLRKLNGLTGEILWDAEYDADPGDPSANGGAYATPHSGRENISDLVIFSLAMTPVTADGSVVNGGRIVALYKDTGKEAWSFDQAADYWSSPAVIYDAEGNAYVIQCDRAGIIRMHDGRTGEALCELDLGSRIESTPAVFNNMLVVGTRGLDGTGESQKIIGIRIG